MMSSAEREWPSHFPPACPPADAEDLSGIVYMLIASDPPTPKDMECAIERRSCIGKPECLRASLSCNRDLGHLEQSRLVSPRLKDHIIGVAKLEPEHGKIKQTGKQGHYSM